MNKTIEALESLKQSKKLEPYISQIRFPKYKNLVNDLFIDFDFPLTILVGPNGTNKSSILRALYSCPDQYNLGSFWFSSDIDPIQEGGGRRNCYIHSYYNSHIEKKVEVLQTRSKHLNDPDYWETSRPLKRYSMEGMPEYELTKDFGRSKTRWDSINKDVTYIDFRSALSAFDKFFYHTDFKSSTKNKRDKVRSVSPHLKKVVDENLFQYSYYRKERIIDKENRLLSDNECSAISEILGRKYTSIRLIKHAFLTDSAYTCLLNTPSLTYSEAFAGSGEFAVVMLVTQILAAKKNSLVLLDEPEVSLHPGAQSRLLDFILNQIKIKHHQIVISTHSTHLLKGLPPSAIKVLVVDQGTGNIKLDKQSSHPSEAFFHLGEVSNSKKTILVEDKLSMELIKRVVWSMGAAANDLLEIQYFSGGASAMWNHIQTYSLEKRKNITVYFDGDLEPDDGIPDQSEIPESQDGNLGNIIKQFTDVDISFPIDGSSQGGNNSQLIQHQRNFISWSKNNVNYLPNKCIPEELLWEVMPKDATTEKIMDEDYKKRFVNLTRIKMAYPDFYQISSAEIFNQQKICLAEIQDFPSIFPEIVKSINDFLARP